MNIERRLRNAETAIIALASILEECVPAAAQESINRCMMDYFESIPNGAQRIPFTDPTPEEWENENDQ